MCVTLFRIRGTLLGMVKKLCSDAVLAYKELANWSHRDSSSMEFYRFTVLTFPVASLQCCGQILVLPLYQ